MAAKSFTTPIRYCKYCNCELEAKRASYDTPWKTESKEKEICAECTAVQTVKEQWKPLPGGSVVSGMFFVKNKLPLADKYKDKN